MKTYHKNDQTSLSTRHLREEEPQNSMNIHEILEAVGSDFGLETKSCRWPLLVVAWTAESSHGTQVGASGKNRTQGSQ